LDISLFEACVGKVVNNPAETAKKRLEDAYCLRGRDLQIVCLLIQHRSTNEMARLMDIPAAEVRRLRDGLIARLGVKNVRALIALVRETQLGGERTSAEDLYHRVLPQLEGAQIITSVLRDKDWCGLLVRLADGEEVTVWLQGNEAGDGGGWLEIDRETVSGAGQSAAAQRRAITDRIHSLLLLLVELSGDTWAEHDDRPESEPDKGRASEQAHTPPWWHQFTIRSTD
jgi:DNA-binding CsgD family transcriptional regulator